MSEIWEVVLTVNHEAKSTFIKHLIFSMLLLVALFPLGYIIAEYSGYLESHYIAVEIINVPIVKNNRIEIETMQRLPNDLVLPLSENTYYDVKLIPFTQNLPEHKLIHNNSQLMNIKDISEKKFRTISGFAMFFGVFLVSLVATYMYGEDFSEYLIKKKFIKNDVNDEKIFKEIISCMFWHLYCYEINDKTSMVKVLDQTDRILYFMISINALNKCVKTILTEEKFDKFTKEEHSEDDIKMLQKIKDSNAKKIFD